MITHVIKWALLFCTKTTFNNVMRQNYLCRMAIRLSDLHLNITYSPRQVLKHWRRLDKWRSHAIRQL